MVKSTCRPRIIAKDSDDENIDDPGRYDTVSLPENGNRIIVPNEFQLGAKTPHFKRIGERQSTIKSYSCVCY